MACGCCRVAAGRTVVVGGCRSDAEVGAPDDGSTMMSPELRAKHSAALKAFWATLSPEQRQQRTAHFNARRSSPDRKCRKEKATTARSATRPTVRELAWAAGFLEGEGCFSRGTERATPRQRAGFSVSAVQVQREPLDRLIRFFGGRVWFRDRGNDLSIWSWGIYGARARGVAMTLYTFMSPKRRAAIQKGLGQ